MMASPLVLVISWVRRPIRARVAALNSMWIQPWAPALLSELMISHLRPSTAPITSPW